jgi:hypothetical protein
MDFRFQFRLVAACMFNFDDCSAAGVRTLPTSFSDSYRLSRGGAVTTEQQSNNNRNLTFWIVIVGSVAALLVIAVIYNMEPAYSRALN